MKTILLLLLSAALSFAADVTGKWTLNVVLDAGGGSPTFEFQQTGEKLTGTYHGQLGDAPLSGTVKGDKIEFSFGNADATAKYSGTVDGNKMKGTCEYGSLGKGTFEGSKQ